MRIELRGRCPKCQIVRTAFGPRDIDPDDLTAIDREIDNCGGVIARCLECDTVEQVAMFLDGEQREPWQCADDYDQESETE